MPDKNDEPRPNPPKPDDGHPAPPSGDPHIPPTPGPNPPGQESPNDFIRRRTREIREAGRKKGKPSGS